MSFIYSFGFGYKVIWDARDVVCFTLNAREKLWWENPFPTTSAKCKSVRMRHANLPDTPADLTGAPK
jgi:hypothetical protein